LLRLAGWYAAKSRFGKRKHAEPEKRFTSQRAPPNESRPVRDLSICPTERESA
jgi:hypothetical protein